MANAVYYNELYLLLPNEYPDFASFKAFLDNAQMPVDVSMVVLREDHRIPYWSVRKGESIAPYFLSGYHDEPSLVRFQDSENVYPVTVEIMDQDTYNTRLREVINGYCPGCKRFKPLTNRVQSLNGHHEEITLNGVCFYRYETNPSPRDFHSNLFSFGGFFKRCNWQNEDSATIKEKLAYLYLRYKSAELTESNGQKTLTLECKKGELLAPILTQFVSEYVTSVLDENYIIALKEEFACTEEYLLKVLSTDNQEAFRKECKKYGVSIGVLEYDASAADRIHASLNELEAHYHMHPLVCTPGKNYYLFTDTSYVLKELHYRTPILEAYGASVAVYDQYSNTRYRISFDMTSEII